MNAVLALHTAGRWYCIAAIPSLMPGSEAEEYARLEKDDSEEACQEPVAASHPTRTEFWHGEFIPILLHEIERIRPGETASLTHCRGRLIEASRIAVDATWDAVVRPGRYTDFTDAPGDEAENRRVLAREREQFEVYVSSLQADTLADVSPLPYRRTMSEDEANEVWWALRERWPSPSLWFTAAGGPSVGVEEMPGVYQFWWWRFAENVPLAALRSALGDAGVQYVWQVGEGVPYEVDVAAFVPLAYDVLMSEPHFTSVGLDWIIYCDHEDRITIAGDPVTALLPRVWPDWERFVDEDFTTAYRCPRCGERLRLTHGQNLYCANADVRFGDAEPAFWAEYQFRLPNEGPPPDPWQFVPPLAFHRKTPPASEVIHYCPREGARLGDDLICPECHTDASWLAWVLEFPDTGR